MPTARINGHDLYYEVLGAGDPVLCMGGWGTFCHENHGHLARGLTERHQVVLFDYRGIRDSGDDLAVPSTMDLHANDAIGCSLPSGCATCTPWGSSARARACASRARSVAPTLRAASPTWARGARSTTFCDRPAAH